MLVSNMLRLALLVAAADAFTSPSLTRGGLSISSSVSSPAAPLAPSLKSNFARARVMVASSTAENVKVDGANNNAKDKTPAAPAPLSAEAKKAIRFSQLLALNSGLLNGMFMSGVLGSGFRRLAVGPVTDSWAKLGLGVASYNFPAAAALAGILASFCAGALITGLLNPNPKTYDLSRRSPLLVASLFMGAATGLLAYSSSPAFLWPTVWLVCAVNGIQNSYTSTLTSNWCRTTHMTGTTTDLFTIAGQRLRGNHAGAFKFPIYSGLIACFTVGAWCGGNVVAQGGKTLNLVGMGLSSSLFLVAAAWPRITKLIRKQKTE